MLASIASPCNSATRPFDRLEATFSALCTLLLLGCLLSYKHSGIDFADESFYLISLANPFLHTASVTQFGLIAHPLHAPLDGNIAVLRPANILIIFGLGWCLSGVFLRTIFSARISDAWNRLSMSSGLASAPMAIRHLWLATPIYNSRAPQAMLLTATGFLPTEVRPTPGSAAGLLLLSAIDGSPAHCIGRLNGGLEFAAMPGGRHTSLQLFRPDALLLDRPAEKMLAGLAAWVFLSACLLQSKWQAFFGAGFALCLAAVAIAAGRMAREGRA